MYETILNKVTELTEAKRTNDHRKKLDAQILKLEEAIDRKEDKQLEAYVKGDTARAEDLNKQIEELNQEITKLQGEYTRPPKLEEKTIKAVLNGINKEQTDAYNKNKRSVIADLNQAGRNLQELIEAIEKGDNIADAFITEFPEGKLYIVNNQLFANKYRFNRQALSKLLTLKQIIDEAINVL